MYNNSSNNLLMMLMMIYYYLYYYSSYSKFKDFFVLFSPIVFPEASAFVMMIDHITGR